MSLRGSETSEAIPLGTANKEIAALPPVARNDKYTLRHSLLWERVRVRAKRISMHHYASLKPDAINLVLPLILLPAFSSNSF
jgi:hypothetical protein